MKQVSGDVKTFAIFLAGFRKKKKKKEPFQTDTHWQCHIRTFQGKRSIPSTGLPYIAFAFR